MSVVDRLLAMDGLGPAVQESESSDRTPMPLGEQRGDFMLLPALRTMDFDIDRLQQPPGDYLVTRRPASVTDRALVHGVDPSRFGRVAGRVRRVRGRRRAQGEDLVHRVSAQEEGEDFPEEPLEAGQTVLPPIAPPRQLRAQPIRSTPVSNARPQPTLPTVSEVRQAISFQQMLAPTSQPPAPPMEEVARVASNGQPAPQVMRRRGKAAAPELADAAEEPTRPQDVSEDDIPQPPQDVALPALKGQARVRGGQPPSLEHKARSGPGKGAPQPAPTWEPNGLVISEPSNPATQPAPAATDEVATVIRQGSLAGPAPAPVPARGSRPAAASAPASPARGLVADQVEQPEPTGLQDSHVAKDQVRQTLGKRAPLVPMGRTGVQRRERDSQAGQPAPSARPAGASVPGRGLAAGASVRSVPPGGPRQVAVSPAIQQAVRGTVGSAPATVRVHEGAHAAQQNDQMNAEAFTRDGEIYLSADIPLHSRRGQELLAHELTHVVQQQGGMMRMPDEASPDGQAHEQAARQVEARVANPSAELIHRVSPTVSSPPAPFTAPNGVQRSAKPLVTNSPGMTMGAPVSRPQVNDDADDQPDNGQQQSTGWGKVRSAGLSWLENQLSEPPPPPRKAPAGRKRRDLERQAQELYPLIRSKLRSELIRDLERRGRLTREWR